jgi:hypothetical protein
MALMREGPLAGTISGSVGNTTFSRNRYGAYIRTRSIPTKRVTPYTTEIRGRLAQLAQAWQGLAAAQQAAWVAWADEHPIINRIGDSQVLQGSDAYIQLNMRLDALGATHIAVPPIASPPAALEGLACSGSAAADSLDITWTSGAISAQEQLAIWVAMVSSAGRNYYKNLLKLVHYSAVSAASPESVGASVVLRFGDILQGQKAFVHAFVYGNNTGLSSALSVANCIIGA